MASHAVDKSLAQVGHMAQGGVLSCSRAPEGSRTPPGRVAPGPRPSGAFVTSAPHVSPRHETAFEVFAKAKARRPRARTCPPAHQCSGLRDAREHRRGRSEGARGRVAQDTPARGSQLARPSRQHPRLPWRGGRPRSGPHRHGRQADVLRDHDVRRAGKEICTRTVPDLRASSTGQVRSRFRTRCPRRRFAFSAEECSRRSSRGLSLIVATPATRPEGSSLAEFDALVSGLGRIRT